MKPTSRFWKYRRTLRVYYAASYTVRFAITIVAFLPALIFGVLSALAERVVNIEPPESPLKAWRRFDTVYDEMEKRYSLPTTHQQEGKL